MGYWEDFVMNKFSMNRKSRIAHVNSNAINHCSVNGKTKIYEINLAILM